MYNFTKENEKRKKYACVYVYCESIVKRAEAGKEVFTSNFKPRATAFDSGNWQINRLSITRRGFECPYIGLLIVKSWSFDDLDPNILNS